ncbi:hypothetical protein EJB05_19950, partial [Eragrostis curvula]
MPDGRGSKKASAGGGDRLGALPDGVLEHVLSFLPSRDAVRTSVLARRWRRRWMTTPSLRVTDWYSIKKCRKFLDHLLLLRGHAPIDTCKLFFGGYSERDVSYVSLGIRYALMCRVRVLRFHIDWNWHGARLPLENLPLITNSLTRLKLHGVDLWERTTDFSGCPVLEVLNLIECCLISLEITSNSLKRLNLTDCGFSYDRRTRICTPNLVWLKIDDSYGHTPQLDSMPLLVTAFVRLGCDSHDYCANTDSWGCSDKDCDGCVCARHDKSAVLLEGLSSATIMELITVPKAFIFRRDLRWCPKFSKLKTLVLNEWCVDTGLDALVCILQHSPVLQKLTIQLCEGTKQKAQTEAIHNPMEHSLALKHLTKVEVKCPRVDERVSTVLEMLRTFGVPLELIDIQQTDRLSQFLRRAEILGCACLLLLLKAFCLWGSNQHLRVTDWDSVEDCHMFMDYLLLLRGRAPIDTCNLFFGDASETDAPYVNLWIRYAVMCSVRVLRFYVEWTRDERLQLEDLPLITNSLTRLKLHGVALSERTTVFSGCPVLEELKLTDCCLRTLEVTSCSLKRLSLADCSFRYDIRTRFSTPNLVWLKIDDSLGHTPLLKRMPLLLTAFVRLGCESFDYCQNASLDCADTQCEGCVCASNDKSAVLLEGLSSATRMELITDPKVFIFSRDLRWCPTFSKLKTLVLNEWCVDTGLDALVCILQHSPVLQKLTLQLCKGTKQKAQTKASHNPMGHSLGLKHLTKVEVKCPRVDERVRAVLEILRTFGVPLELIDIQQIDRLSTCFSFEQEG